MKIEAFTATGAIAIIIILSLSPLASAVSIRYEANLGEGDTVVINDNYNADNTVTVEETTAISFGNPQLNQDRTAKGTGKADLKQETTGKTNGNTNYIGENIINSEGTISAKTSSSATGNTLDVDQSVSATGNAESILSGTQGGDNAMQKTEVSTGSLSSTQSMNIRHSVSIFQTTNLEGTGYVRGSASTNGNLAETEASVEGSLSSTLNTKASGVAENSQTLEATGNSLAKAYAKEGTVSSEFNAQVQDEGGEAEEKMSGNLYAGAGSPQIAYGDLSIQGDKVILGTTSTNQFGSYTGTQTKKNVKKPIKKQQTVAATEDYIETSWEDEGTGTIEPINQIIDVSDEESTKKITNTVEGEGSYKIGGFSLITEDGASFYQNINCEGSVNDNIDVESHSEFLRARSYTEVSGTLDGSKWADIKKGGTNWVFVAQNYGATGDIKQSAEAETKDGHAVTAVYIDDGKKVRLGTTAKASYNQVSSNEIYRRTRVTQDVLSESTWGGLSKAKEVSGGAFAEYGGQSANAVSSVKDPKTCEISLSAETVKSAVAEQEVKSYDGEIKARTFSMNADFRGTKQLISEDYPDLAEVLSRYGSKALIITGGTGPLTGISPEEDAAFWEKILKQEGYEAEKRNWEDIKDDPDYLKSRNVIVFTAGGYWFSLDQDVDKLQQVHDAGKSLIVVAPDINYDWSNHPQNVPPFCTDSLHIDGALGIMPDNDYSVYADTGHPITNGLPNEIVVPAVNSWPDSFDPGTGGEGVLSQGPMDSEFGVGSLQGEPAYSYYDPDTYAVVAYPGSATEGKSVVFGFVPSGLESDVANSLAQNTANWVLEPQSIETESNIEIDATGDVGDFQTHMHSHAYPSITHGSYHHNNDEFVSYATVGVDDTWWPGGANLNVNYGGSVDSNHDIKEDTVIRYTHVEGGVRDKTESPSRVYSGGVLEHTPDDQTPWGIEAVYGNENIEETSGGNGIDIAVIDGGFDINHPDLVMQVEDCATTGAGVSVGSVPISEHGTHVAGIAAANAGFDKKGIYGVAPDADLYLYTSGSTTEAIYRAVDLGAEVISMSYKTTPLAEINNAIDYAFKNDVLIVKSAGNGIPAGSVTVSYPGNVNGVIAVGAIDKNEVSAWWSSPGSNDKDNSITGGEVSFGAPGVKIESTLPTNSGWYGGNHWWNEWSGTSMAAPHISGLAAKLWSDNLDWTSDDVKNKLYSLARQDDITKVKITSETLGFETQIANNVGTNDYYAVLNREIDNLSIWDRLWIIAGGSKDVSPTEMIGEDWLTGLGFPHF